MIRCRVQHPFNANADNRRGTGAAPDSMSKPMESPT